MEPLLYLGALILTVVAYGMLILGLYFTLRFLIIALDFDITTDPHIALVAWVRTGVIFLITVILFVLIQAFRLATAP